MINICKNCVFCEKDGYKDMGFSIDTCKIIFYIEKNKDQGDIFKSLLTKERIYCQYYLDINNLIKNTIDNINNICDN